MALEPWQEAWKDAAVNRDPVRFVRGVLGVEAIEPWQMTVLNALRDGKSRISIRSGHGVGKTTLHAWLVLYALLCLGEDTKIPIAAGSRDQLRDTIQPEIGKWHQRLPEALRSEIAVDVERISVKSAPESAFAVFRTASKDNPQALAGFHAENIWFLIDEASAVADVAFEVAMGALSTPGAVGILTGNPTKASGFFHATHHKLRDRWLTLRVSSEDVPRARGHIEDVIAAYGKDSNRYRVRVLGEFPSADDETVIPLDLVEGALGRDVAAKEVYPVMGVDVARFGDDTSTICLRQGNVILALKEWRNLDGAQVAGRIQQFVASLPNHQKPREIVVDVIGVGASVYDMLRLPGSELDTITRGCNVSETPSVSEVDHRLRDELWFRGRAWFAERDCSIPRSFAEPDDTPLIEKLVAELTAPTYDFTALGKRKVESKKDMKERGVPSPNLADAFLLSLAAGIYPKRDPRYFQAEAETGSWMAA